MRVFRGKCPEWLIARNSRLGASLVIKASASDSRRLFGRTAGAALAAALSLLVTGVAGAEAEQGIHNAFSANAPAQQGQKGTVDTSEASATNTAKQAPSSERAETNAPPSPGGLNAAPTQAEPASAQPTGTSNPPASSGRRIEEIIVTAQKTKQAQIDVPIAMTALSGDFLTSAGIQDLRDLAAYAPNTYLRTEAVFPDFRIRGFGSNPVNANFEQSVGLAMDGIPYSRKAYFQGGLFDIGDVEVLRGPQGTLYGKNSTAGLVAINSKDPTDEYHGFIDLQGGSYNFRRLEFGAGGPAIYDRKDLVNVRISGLLEDRDGYMKNTTRNFIATAPKDLFGENRKAVRVKVDFPNILGSDLKLMFEREHLDLFGGDQYEFIQQDEQAFFKAFDPTVNFDKNVFRGSVAEADRSKNDIYTGVAHWRTDFAEGWGLNVDAGYSLLQDLILVGTGDPAPASNVKSTRDSPQLTGEIRLSSPRMTGLFGLGSLFGRSLGRTRFTAGFFFQEKQWKNFRETVFINDMVASADTNNYQCAQRNHGTPLEFLPCFVGPAPSTDPAFREASSILYHQTQDAYDPFAQLEWEFLPQWNFIAGARLSNELTDGHIERVFDTTNHTVFSQVLGWTTFSKQLTRSESDFTPKVVLNYRPNPDLNFFVSWSEGVKGGGFNDFATGGSDAELRYKREQVQQWEFNMKTRFLEDTAEFNLALFWMDLHNFQTLVLVTGPIAAVGPINLGASGINDLVFAKNAPKARSRGVEADGSWRATTWLTFRDAAGFVDARYLDFKFGNCTLDNFIFGGCDQSGRPLPFTPKWSNTLSTQASYPLSAFRFAEGLPSAVRRLELSSMITWEWNGREYLDLADDPRKAQGVYNLVNAHIGFHDPRWGWTLRFNVTNLTDTRYQAFRTDIHAFQWVQVPNPPRMYSVGLRYQF